MKIVLGHIDGDVMPGDMVIVSASNARYGGRSNARFDVPEVYDRIEQVNGKKIVVSSKTDIGEVTRRVVNEINSHWDGFQAAVRNEREFIIQCSEACTETVFESSVIGNGTAKIELEVLG